MAHFPSKRRESIQRGNYSTGSSSSSSAMAAFNNTAISSSSSSSRVPDLRDLLKAATGPTALQQLQAELAHPARATQANGYTQKPKIQNQRFTAAVSDTAGPVFECMIAALCQRQQQQQSAAAAASGEEERSDHPTPAGKQRTTTVSSSPPQQQKQSQPENIWIPSKIPVGAAAAVPASKTAASSKVCCSRLHGVNLYLGDKLAVEALVDEARVVAMRMRRISNALSLNTAAPCIHEKRRSALARSDRSTAPGVTLVNYYSGLRCITLKASMVRTLCEGYGSRECFASITPETYILLPGAAQGDERAHWLKAIQRGATSFSEGASSAAAFSDNIWIAKSSHGKGGEQIQMVVPSTSSSPAPSTTSTVRNQKQLLQFIDKQKDAPPHPWVLQRYVSRPLLLDGRKFDIRIWVLLSPEFDVYVYREGVCRLSGEKYNSADFTNSMAHITNHCLQAEGENYGKYEKGNELSLEQLDKRVLSSLKVAISASELAASSQRHPKSLPPLQHQHQQQQQPKTRPASYDRDIAPQAENIILATLAAAKRNISSDPFSSVKSFQLLGYDFILDASCKLWLLEVNGAPGIAQHLQKMMVEDVIEKVIEPTFPTDFRREDGLTRPNLFKMIMSSEEWGPGPIV